MAYRFRKAEDDGERACKRPKPSGNHRCSGMTLGPVKCDDRWMFWQTKHNYQLRCAGSACPVVFGAGNDMRVLGVTVVGNVAMIVGSLKLASGVYVIHAIKYWLGHGVTRDVSRAVSTAEPVKAVFEPGSAALDAFWITTAEQGATRYTISQRGEISVTAHLEGPVWDLCITDTTLVMCNSSEMLMFPRSLYADGKPVVLTRADAIEFQYGGTSLVACVDPSSRWPLWHFILCSGPRIAVHAGSGLILCTDLPANVYDVLIVGGALHVLAGHPGKTHYYELSLSDGGIVRGPEDTGCATKLFGPVATKHEVYLIAAGQSLGNYAVVNETRITLKVL